MKYVVCLLILFVTTIGYGATNGPTGFNGHEWFDHISEFKGLKFWAKTSDGECDQYTILGETVKYLEFTVWPMYNFKNDRFESVALIVKPEFQMSEVIEILITSLGQPTLALSGMIRWECLLSDITWLPNGQIIIMRKGKHARKEDKMENSEKTTDYRKQEGIMTTCSACDGEESHCRKYQEARVNDRTKCLYLNKFMGDRHCWLG